MTECCIMFSPVSAVSGLLTKLRKCRTFLYNATLTANMTEFCILFLLMSTVSALLTKLRKRRMFPYNATLRFTQRAAYVNAEPSLILLL